MKKIQLSEIKPGIGLGQIKFGMSREEVKSLLGKPNEIIEEAYDEERKDRYDSWEYHELYVDFTFDQENDWRLSGISVYSDEYLLFNEPLIGLDKVELMDQFTALQINDIEFEDMSSEEAPDHHLFSSDKTQINFWVDLNILIEIQWSPFYLDDETIKWPD